MGSPMLIVRSMLAAVVAGALMFAVTPSRADELVDTTEEDRWVEGNLIFLAYHEVGHLLLDQVMRVDQSRNRLEAEQKSDDIATWLISPDPEEEIDGSEAIAAIEGWLDAQEESDANGPQNPAHAPDADLYPDAETRASRIACLLWGSDTSEPNAFEALEPIATLRFDKSTCRRDYQMLDRSMEAVFGDTDMTRANPVARVEVFYDAAAPALTQARDFLIQSRVLEDLKEDLVHAIGAPVNVVLRGASCGQDSPGFIYSPSRREITACYEEVDWFLFGDTAAGTPSARREHGSDDMGARPRRIAPRQAQSTPPPPPRR